MEGTVDKDFKCSQPNMSKSSYLNSDGGESRWKRSVKRRFDDNGFDATIHNDYNYVDKRYDDTSNNDTRYDGTIYSDASLSKEVESHQGILSSETRTSTWSSNGYEKMSNEVEKMPFDAAGAKFNIEKLGKNVLEVIDSCAIDEGNLFFERRRSTWSKNDCENVSTGAESTSFGDIDANIKLEKQGINGHRGANSSDPQSLIKFQGTSYARELSRVSFERSTSRNECENVCNDSERMPLDDIGSTFKFEKPGRKTRDVAGSSDFHSFIKTLGSRPENVNSGSFIQRSTSHKFEPFSNNVQVVGTNAQSRKRCSPHAALEADQDFIAYPEVMMLKKALKSERDAIQKLYKELEEERRASKTAADEAISMIMRIQDEKAAALMEAWQYRRVVEERDCHNQEAITLLKEALLDKEYELLSLQERMDVYKEMFMRIQSGQGIVQDNFLEEGLSKENLLLLGSEETETSLPYADGKHIRYHYGNQIMDKTMLNEADLHEPQTGILDFRCSREATPDSRRLNLGCHVKDIQVFHDGKNYEYLSGEDGLIQTAVLERSHEAEFGNTDNDGHSLGAEDMSVTILDRVKRLEERLEYIRHSQVLHREDANHSVSPHNVDLEESKHYSHFNIQEVFSTKREQYSSLNIDTKGKCSTCEKSMNPSCENEVGKVFECLSAMRHLKNLGIQNREECSMTYDAEAESGMKEVVSRGWETDTSKAMDGDDVGESIHDVYEVHEIKESIMHSDGFLCRTVEDRHGSGAGNASFYRVQESEEASMDEVILPTHGSYGAETSKLSVEFSALNIHKNVGDEDVDQLKVRLQALEGERVFMKEAIESLRKENGELKLLQEIAQQLRELKGDVRRVEGSAMQGHLPFVSFFKSLMSFAGIQHLSTIEESRFCHSFQRKSMISSTTQDGLLQILNKCSEAPRNGYVTREYKIKIKT